MDFSTTKRNRSFFTSFRNSYVKRCNRVWVLSVPVLNCLEKRNVLSDLEGRLLNFQKSPPTQHSHSFYSVNS